MKLARFNLPLLVSYTLLVIGLIFYTLFPVHTARQQSGQSDLPTLELNQLSQLSHQLSLRQAIDPLNPLALDKYTFGPDNLLR
jgi:hypothetical protein